ncbi:Amino acid permease family protein [Hibiscus syriacus]|uniref:Amino acid permease family protein n=1 Tax=Hibiscus syriacus TaxID=106335 RepID=A0A6A2WA55_HIBSY|nr:Amino acid permease family protein [Hibiscus syriacus]
METDNPIIEDPNSNTNEGGNRHSSSTSSRSSSLSFFSHNGFGSSQFSDVEMAKVQSGSYTSLKDLLPRGSSSPVICSPTTSTTGDNSSWHEIPIKNPLLKHAALAYLQPVGSPPPACEKGLLGRLKEMCCRECGCFMWIFDVVFEERQGGDFAVGGSGDQ